MLRSLIAGIMERISSNLTLFFKIFIPTFWIVFFGAVLAAAILTPYEHVAQIRRGPFQISVLLFFLSGVVMLYFTLMQLKRVEMDSRFIYATNYFKTYRYPYHNIERIEVNRFLFFNSAVVHLQQGGRFGSQILFIPSLFRLRDFLENHPEVSQQLKVEGL